MLDSFGGNKAHNRSNHYEINRPGFMFYGPAAKGANGPAVNANAPQLNGSDRLLRRQANGNKKRRDYVATAAAGYSG